VLLNHWTDFEETRYKQYGRRSTLQRRNSQLPASLRNNMADVQNLQMEGD
jgi:hypothetical protein